MFADFQNSFTIGFSQKFAIKHLSRYPPHRNYVATLPCETWNTAFIILPQQLLQNVHRNSFSILSDTYYRNVLLTQQ